GEDRFRLGVREGTHVVAQRRQLGRVRFGEQVGARAQDLAELHEGRPEILADSRSRRARSWGGTSSPSATRSIGRTSPSRCRAATTSWYPYRTRDARIWR